MKLKGRCEIVCALRPFDVISGASEIICRNLI